LELSFKKVEKISDSMSGEVTKFNIKVGIENFTADNYFLEVAHCFSF
jgi:hypothetical protein